ncbi:hypothetical protein OOK36_35395 [Streptomyces sp. NBC_00365]|uniref:hypothetical protein n=1 Tax=Streptomyces sp. NBC_00365 TaxID=2975726 RepID=UPI002257EF37|nr:hypothetical protein [Streptomyces sp. NBC_00365]MCX5094061.1 hypothetical protein [Streptomyces sp. NBC_00365]
MDAFAVSGCFLLNNPFSPLLIQTKSSSATDLDPLTDVTAHDDGAHGPDRPGVRADLRADPGSVARAGEAARQAGARVDDRLEPLGAAAAS